MKRQSRMDGGLDYPSAPVISCSSPYDRTLTFTCVECSYEFGIDVRDYRGQFDHSPNEPICPDCKESLA